MIDIPSGFMPVINLLATIVSDDTGPLSEEPEIHPIDVVMWKVLFTSVQNSSGNSELKALLTHVARDKLPSGVHIDDYVHNTFSNAPKWKPTQESIDPDRETGSLSIKHKDYSHIVPFLDNSNLEFTKGIPPFQVKNQKSAYYSRAMCAWIGASGPESGKTPDPAFPCHVGYFIANSTDDLARFGKPKGHKRIFTTHYNLYIDIVEPATSTKAERRIPIVVDPDVGHPGGWE